MIRSLLGFFRPPVFLDDHEKTRDAHTLNTLINMGLGIVAIALLIGVPFFFSNKMISTLVSLYLLLSCLLSQKVLKNGNLRLAVVFFLINLHIAVGADFYSTGGIDSRLGIFYALPICISALLLDFRWALVSSLVTVTIVTVYGFLGYFGVEIPKLMPPRPLGIWFLTILIVWILFLSVRLSVEGWHKALAQLRQELEDKRRTEGQRDKLKEALFQAQKMESLGRMAGGVAHDFNNLLMVISANVEEMKGRLANDQTLQEDIAQAEKAIMAAQRLNRSLLDFSKNRELQLERFEWDGLVQETSPVIEQLLGKNLRLELALGATGAQVMADRTGLTQVLHNLTINAKEAMNGGGVLVLKTAVHYIEREEVGLGYGKYIRLIVRDNGHGMNSGTKERIFEPFFSTKEKGTGLGLATVFGVVQQHNGFIEVDSKPGKGTEFRVYLPCV
jgi:signal transduction histidine kinase